MNRKIIQMIWLSPENSMFLIDFNDKLNELVFRDLKNKSEVQKETITIDKPNNMVITKNYHFPIGYLQKFIQENT